MEIDGLAGWYVRPFMNRDGVMGASFRQKGIDRLATQAGEGSVYLVTTSASASPADLIDAGRRFERAALLAVDRNLGLHPMSQILEEQPWRDQISRQLGVDAVQFVVRVGRVRSRRPPVSPRRPLRAFVTSA